MLKLAKRGKVYYVRGTYRGTEIYASTKSDRKSEAEEFLRSLQRELDTEIKNFGKKTFGEALDAYIAQGGPDRHSSVINKHIGHVLLDDVNQEVVDGLIQAWIPNATPHSKNSMGYGYVMTVINFAARMGWTHYRKIRRVKARRNPPQWAEPEWFGKLFGTCAPEVRRFVIFLVYTGCRGGEALRLTWENVNIDRAEAYIPNTKTRVPRTVHLPKPVLEELMSHPEREGRVFPWQKLQKVNERVRWACKKAKIPYMSSHKFGSHTYATWMRRYAGMDIRGLVATGRWQDINSAMIYSHTIASQEATLSDKLPDIRAISVQRNL